MSAKIKTATFLCNGAVPSGGVRQSRSTVLDYRLEDGRVYIGLPDFVANVFHLPDRCLDLLEIAAYVFAADRLTSRGSKSALEYQSWSRKFHIFIKVRDCGFWSQPSVHDALVDALCFATGDRSYKFTFQPGHKTPPTNIFDNEIFEMPKDGNPSMALFSGGLDSLSGAIEKLNHSDERVCLISHVSQPGTSQTQRLLVGALRKSYGDRVHHYRFKTRLKGVRGSEETQRSRPFLYGSIAFAMATAFGRDSFCVYENGVTSINFTRRDDLISARASRTTHPQTIGLLSRLFSIISEKPFRIETPFIWHTKSDVVKVLKESEHKDLLSVSVSCSRTYKLKEKASHCGECFQCLDRRIGVYGADAHELDISRLYATDIVASGVDSGESKTTIVDYLRQAVHFSGLSLRRFYVDMLDELRALTGWIPDYEDEDELVEKVWELYSRHSDKVALALRRMRDKEEDVFEHVNPSSLLKIISDREFLREPIERLVDSIEDRLGSALPKAFRHAPPNNELDLNDKIESLLDMWSSDLKREHPSVPFAGARVIPDFSLHQGHTLIEGKYIRGSTTPSRVTEGMSADLTKYPQEAHTLFVVYDPENAITDRVALKRDFEGRGRCTICVLP